MQVGQCDFRRQDAACQPKRRRYEMVVAEPVTGFDIAHLDVRARHAELEVLQQTVVASAFVFQR